MLALFNQMYLDGRIIEKQKHGIVMCLPKTDIPTKPADYRPITLLNTDYKILARILVNRLRRTLSDMLHPSQCWVLGNTIFDAMPSVREAKAYSELTRPNYVSFLGFHSNFWQDFAYLSITDAKNYGYSMKIIPLMQAIYDKALSSV